MVIQLGVTILKKDQFRVPPGLVWGKGEKEFVLFSVFGVPLDDWANGGADILMW